MKISIAFADTPTIFDSLKVQKKIAQGKFSVYEVHSPRHNANYALKVFPKDSFGTTQYRKEKLMFQLSHPNIIQHVPTACSHPRFYTLLTEYAKYGDFFDIVTGGLLHNEILARTYFHQLIKGIEYIHSQGIAHLDLKLENIMLGEDCLLKIIDFDQAQPISDKVMTSGGTSGYRAPEVIDGTCQDLTAVDVYSAGIILYAFLVHEFPFMEIEDPKNEDHRCYSTFAYNNSVYWRAKSKVLKNKRSVSRSFVELINGMLQEDPAQRMTIQEVKNSKWYKGPTFNMERLQMIMQDKTEQMMMKRREAK